MKPWAWLRRVRRLDEDLDDEIRAHLSMAAADMVDQGESAEKARLRARRDLGNELLIKEVTRDMWGWTAWERLAQNLRLALRQMRRGPGFAAVAIATLALGLGATTAMFSIVNSVLLEPLQYRQPERLFIARTVPPASAHIAGDLPNNARHFHEWRTHCRSCEGTALIQFADLTLAGFGEPVKLPALAVSFDFFKTLGVQPVLGREFLPDEELAGRGGVVILTDRLWRSRFAADPAILGRRIQLNGELHTVVGVMPASLELPVGNQWGEYFGPAAAPLIFRPLWLDVAQAYPAGSLNYSALIRLKAGVSRQQGIAELNALLADLVRQYELVTKTTLIPLDQQVTRDARSSLWLLLGTVGAVLLIVCVNIGNLMLVRTTSRYREAGIRMALGAGRGAMFAMVLEEALALSALGGALGLGLAWMALKVFVAEAPVSLPRLAEVHMDWRVVVFAAMAIAFSTLACGLVPAWRLARTAPMESLKAGAAQTTEAGRKLRLREWMVAVEVALSTVLLMLGGLLLASFSRVMRVEKGFAVEHVITQEISFLNPKYAHGGRQPVVQELVEQLARIPGVVAAGATSRLPLTGEEWVSGLRDTDHLERAPEPDAVANFRFVTPDYWKALGIPLVQGRYLEASDRNQPRAVISDRTARYLWPGQNAIGKHVRGAGPSKPTLEVVGVVGEVRTAGLEKTPPMMVYEHYWRMQPVGMSFVLRTAGDPISAARDIRAILSKADPDMAIARPETMAEIVDQSVAARKFQMGLAVAFAVAALLVASLGIYGVISFTVARRTPEMGIRIALGAGRGQLMGMVLRQGMRPVVLGLAAGLCGALALGSYVAAQLYGVTPHDPWTMTAVAGLLLLVAAGACWIPARRATRIDPLGALRME